MAFASIFIFTFIFWKIRCFILLLDEFLFDFYILRLEFDSLQHGFFDETIDRDDEIFQIPLTLLILPFPLFGIS